MKKLLLIFLSILLYSHLAWAQKHTISGYITDAQSRETLIGVTIADLNTGAATMSNTYGFFSLTLPANSDLKLRASYLGYENYETTWQLQQDTVLNIALSTQLLELETVTIKAEREVHQERIDVTRVSVREIKQIPALLGETDVLKALQLLPGVQSGGEGQNGLNVRGGSPDQNLILLDGVPVYNASHLFGFFSVFNADALKHVELVKGGFPARYGGRLSSVIDISMKEGNMDHWTAEGSVGLISTKLLLEGPLVKNKASVLFSARRTYLDYTLLPLMKVIADEEDIPSYFFHDFTAKVNYIVSPKDRIFASAYVGLDKFKVRNNYESYDGIYSTENSDNFFLKWGNTTAALRWNHVYGKKMFSNLTAIYSKYKLSAGSIFEQKATDPQSGSTFFRSNSIEYGSDIHDWGLKLDYDYFPSPKHNVKFGAGGVLHTFAPNVVQLSAYSDTTTTPSEITQAPPQTHGMEYTAYIEDQFDLGKRLNANIGVHTSAFAVRNVWYTSAQPRVSLGYALGKVSLQASFATMTQFLHLLTNSGIGLPTDLWVASTDKVPPQRSWQATLGISGRKTLWGVPLNWSIEGYYKDMRNLIEYREGVNFLASGPDGDFDNSGNTWEEKVEKGRGWSYGSEFFVRKQEGRTTGWLKYTLSWSNRQFDNINNGVAFAYRYDRRHDIALVLSHKLGKKINLSGTWVYTSGAAVSVPLAQYYSHPDIGYTYVDYYNTRNNVRMPAYHRLDVGIEFHKQKKWGERTWVLSFYNAYSRQNPYFIYNDGKEVFKQVSLFPIIPAFSYQFKFK
jgi:hypothetical protein